MENLGGLDKITEMLSVFSAWAISITAIVAALSAVCKPVRNLVKYIFSFLFKKKDEEKNEILAEIKEFESRINKKVDGIIEKVDDNERDRLKQIIFDFGNRARRHEKISGEDFRNLQSCYHKYHDVLKGNGAGQEEYKFVEHYYNESGWEKEDY